MFKINSFEEELAKSFESNLKKAYLDKENGFSKVAKAIDLINNAANIFDESGLHKEADHLTQILESLK